MATIATIATTTVARAFVILLGIAAPAEAKPDRKILAAVESCTPGARTLLEQVVVIDSGSGDAQGLAKVGAIFSAKLRDLGAAVRQVPSMPPGVGDNIVATFKGGGAGRILLIAHIDTVFDRGTVAKRPPRWEGQRFFGPGAADDKGGAVTAICALSALRSAGFRDFAQIDLLLNASEEPGSPGSRDLIRAMARDADVTINLERGQATDKAVVGRKGRALLTMAFTGWAAHSGLEPQNGRNAALEAAHAALDLSKLGNPALETTVTVTILTGGDKINVVPDHASISADVRAYSLEEFDRVRQGAAQIAASPTISGVSITSRLDMDFPPWPRAASTDQLLARADGLYGEIGRSLTGVSVGSSADVAFAAESGKPAIDGFGMEGAGAHGLDEYADFATLSPRAYLLARMLMDLGRNPPR
jgi:glutamate carboxypeptidase